MKAPNSFSKSISHKTRPTHTPPSPSNRGGIDEDRIIRADAIRIIPRNRPFELNPPPRRTSPGSHNPAGETPAPELLKNGEPISEAPNAAVGERVAAAAAKAVVPLAALEVELLAVDLADGGVVAVVEADDVVGGDAQEGVGGGGEGEGVEEVEVAAAGGDAGEVEEEEVGGEVEDGEGEGGEGEGGGVGGGAGEAEGGWAEAAGGVVEVEGERNVEVSALLVAFGGKDSISNKRAVAVVEGETQERDEEEEEEEVKGKHGFLFLFCFFLLVVGVEKGDEMETGWKREMKMG